MLPYLSGSCRSSLTQSHSAWPARSYYPSLLQHIAGCCSSSGQSSGTWPETQTKIQNIVFSAFFTQQLLDCILSSTHSEPIAPLPAAVVHGVSSVQSDPKPVLLMVLWLPVGHIIIVIAIIIILHHLSPGQTVTPTQRPRGGPAEQSAPPRGRWYSAGWLHASDRRGEPAASSASAPAGRNGTPAVIKG